MKVERLGFEEERGGGGNVVVVGVKLDGGSRELLTWVLVKVAQPGDQIIALHVLNSTEVLDGDGKSSLLSLVKAFDSVLAVYEGFCNLKQVDLKLKICRGSSVRKVLVREAKSYSARKVIVGIAKNNYTIGSSTSVAKYCSKKLPLDRWVLAVNNGKVIFQREAASSGNETVDCCRNTSLFSVIHRTLSKNFKVPNSGFNEDSKNGKKNGQDQHDPGVDSSHSLSVEEWSDCGAVAVGSNPSCYSLRQNCSVCASNMEEAPCSDARDTEEGNGDSLAMVPVQTLEGASSSISLLIRELPELRPGWPLICRSISPDRQASERSTVSQISVVQWAMRMPVHLDHKPMEMEDVVTDRPNLDGESGAIVVVGDADSPGSIPIHDDEVKHIPKELKSLHDKYSSTCRLFSYRELLSATSNFSSERLIGKGGNSQVYKGCLPDGKELAVKILKLSDDALKEFVLEIEIITTLHHNNIISLFGFCFEDNKLLLVYDFLSRGSLEENLHGKKDDSVFGWAERYKVALGVAEALDYLHSERAQPVIHRDVKSSNVLLADDFEPQLSDFGLATWASTSSSHITCSDVAGTFGYLAPEYFMYGKVNDKIDVYAFGVILLELLSGRKPISNENPKGQESLVMWAMPILRSGKVMQLLDPIFRHEYDNDQMEKMVLAASLCIRRAPRLRPRMGLILKLLKGDDEATKWARLQVSALEEFDTLDDEAYPVSNIQSHLNLALLDVEDDSISIDSVDCLTAHKSLEDYLQARWSRSSSFDLLSSKK
ncbi:protein kinase STUNTED-like isoform X2 [Tasmannia lanceolata]|uniref:protein kinase STUNTED-like isoform X2 n=1 Tax=Tasmannia lanceolata TaxID=3420 RepID=UPI0040645D95